MASLFGTLNVTGLHQARMSWWLVSFVLRLANWDEAVESVCTFAAVFNKLNPAW